MRVLRESRPRARHFCPGLLGTFLSRNIEKVKSSTRLHPGDSVERKSEILAATQSAELAGRAAEERYLLRGTAFRECGFQRAGRFERGEGRLKAIIYLAILILAVYSAFRVVPIYLSNYELVDKMQEQARFAVVNRYSDDQIRDNIFKIVQDLDVPAKREDIKVEATNSLVKISLDYTVPVDLFFYHTDLHFTPSSENKSVY